MKFRLNVYKQQIKKDADRVEDKVKDFDAALPHLEASTSMSTEVLMAYRELVRTNIPMLKAMFRPSKTFKKRAPTSLS